MKFIDFCTDVTAIGVTVVLSLVLAGGVASRDVSETAPTAVARTTVAPAAVTPEITIPPAERTAEKITRDAPRPLDLADLERSLDALLGTSDQVGLSPTEASTGFASSKPVMTEEPVFDLSTTAPEPAPEPEIDWDATFADSVSLPMNVFSERPDTSVPAPATKPLIAVPRDRVLDFMSDLVDDNGFEELPAPPSASRPIGRLR